MEINFDIMGGELSELIYALENKTGVNVLYAIGIISIGEIIFRLACMFYYYICR